MAKRKKKQIVLLDGPIPNGQCVGCGLPKKFDVYRCDGLVLCGDCRFKYRHGYYPAKENGCGHATVLPSRSYYHSEFPTTNSETLHRPLRMQAVTARHAKFLSDWLDDSTLSLD